MSCNFKTKEFTLDYRETRVFEPFLLENHCHDRFEMITPLEGDIHIILEGRSYKLEKNQMIIIPPLCYHSIIVGKNQTYKRVTALFSLSALPEVLRPLFLKNSADVTVLPSAYNEALRDLCQKGDETFYTPLAQSLMTQIFYQFAKGPREPYSVQTDEFLQQVILYVDEHLEEKILLDDLAKHASRSKSSFCHLFEQKMNISPKQYILQKKMALAKKRISEGVPPTVAAAQVGYDNYSNFYRLYVKHFKEKPADGK